MKTLKWKTMSSSRSSLISNNLSLIEGHMHTIESLDSMVRSQRQEPTRLREKDAEYGIERRLLMTMIEAKDKDIRCLTQQMAQFLGKEDALTKALEDKSYQLSSQNREKFGTMTNRTRS